MTRAGGPRRVSVDDLTRISWPVDPAIHPSGGSIAYSKASLDTSEDRLAYEIHEQRIGSEDDPGNGRSGRSPKWSPDGTSLAWLHPSDDGPQIIVARNGDTLTLGPMPGGVGDYHWSPEGDTIVVTPPTPQSGSVGGHQSPTEANVLKFVDIFDPSHLRLGSIPTRVAISARWSPSLPRTVAVIGDNFDSRLGTGGSGLWLVSDRDDKSHCLLRWQGPMEAVAWSPDGSHLAVVGHPYSRGRWVNKQLWVVPVDPESSAWQLGKELDRSIGQVVRGDDERGIGPPDVNWSIDGGSVLAAYAIGGRSVLGRFGLEGSHEVLLNGDRAVLEFDVAERSGDIAFTWSDPGNPGELSILKGDVENLCTGLNEAWLGDVRLAPTIPIKTTRPEGVTVEGWLTIPDREDPDGAAPLVIQIHGGPHYPIGYRFSFDAQRLAARGIALLRGNPRGSQGYGEEFAVNIRGDWGGADYGDVLALVDAASARPEVDGRRVGVVGESYGGFLTNWILTQSQRFVAAAVENGISDLYSLGMGKNGPSFWHLEFDGSPEDAPERYIDRSPLSHVTGVSTPLLLIHAEQDETCPISQSESLLTALTESGRNVEMVRVSGEGHFMNVFGRPSSRKARAQTIDDFFVSHLMCDLD